VIKEILFKQGSLLFIPLHKLFFFMAKAGSDLSITKKGKAKLTPNQSAFNRLTAKIEKLRKSLDTQRSQLDKALVIYGNEFHPLRKMLQQKQRNLISIFWRYYHEGNINRRNLVHLRHILKAQLDNYLSHSEEPADEELKEIYTELQGEDYEDAERRTQEEAKEGFMENLRKMNIDVDMEGVDMRDEAAVAAKMAEIKQKIKEKEEEDEKYKKYNKGIGKTAGEAERDEVKQKSISTLYKQLAKFFHPDLEQDAELRAEKEVLMKELTVAYEEKNLHAMLMLELQWIHKENAHLAQLTDEKLHVYLQLLKEQEAELEQQKRMIFAAPQYAVLVNEFGHSITRMPVQYLQMEMSNLNDYKNGLSDTIAKLESRDGQRHISDLIKEWKDEQQRNSYEDDDMGY
jgi:hypothetical protein